ncbi:hypothetical protein CL619_01480 [archaeon]|nr:hypothetical protein [archaeon]|tara:strand:+ start:536 stop:1498 length:963 start_codon:yes stop_codon:yes gene_type:complete
MNFEKIPPVETPKELLDIAFRKAREKVTKKDFKGKPAERARDKGRVKIDISAGYIQSRLRKSMKDFPSFDHLPEFYVKLIDLTLDLGALKKSLAALNWAEGKILFFQRTYSKKVSAAREYETIQKQTKEFYGRVSSVLKQIKNNIEYLNECRKIMKTYPDIKDRFTVCLYGFPNVGKSTLLNKLTGTNAKTAAYSFTTKSINCGFLDGESPKKETAIQVLDVPGTLARKEKMNLIELQAELVLEELANLVVYVFDATETFPLKDQIKLYQKAKKKRPTIAYLSKQDILSKEQFSEFSKTLPEVEVISFEKLREQILSKRR